METTNEKLIRYLQDAHAAEVGIKKALEGFLNDDSFPETQAAFREHIQMTEAQAMMLETRLRELGAGPSDGKGFFNSLMAKLSEMMQGMHDELDKATQNLIKAYATEHLERGMYEALAAYASSINDERTAALARQIQSQEEQTAQLLFPMISRLAPAAQAAATNR